MFHGEGRLRELALKYLDEPPDSPFTFIAIFGLTLDHSEAKRSDLTKLPQCKSALMTQSGRSVGTLRAGRQQAAANAGLIEGCPDFEWRRTAG